MHHIYSRGLDSLVRSISRHLHPQTRPVNVLIVDDEEPIRKFVERVLTSAGFRTAVASGGAEALKVASTLDLVDVLVTDLMMPGMNGDELARCLRATDRDLKVLYLTGYSDRLFAERVRLWEDEAFLDKPCSIKALTEALSLLVSGHIESPSSDWATAPAVPAAHYADAGVGARQ